jgi:hypothetical protein
MYLVHSFDNLFSTINLTSFHYKRYVMKKLRFPLEIIVVVMSGCGVGYTTDCCFEHAAARLVDIGTQKELIDEKTKRTDSA